MPWNADREAAGDRAIGRPTPRNPTRPSAVAQTRRAERDGVTASIKNAETLRTSSSIESSVVPARRVLHYLERRLGVVRHGCDDTFDVSSISLVFDRPSHDVVRDLLEWAGSMSIGHALRCDVSAARSRHAGRQGRR